MLKPINISVLALCMEQGFVLSETISSFGEKDWLPVAVS